jgi:hexosaminidase
VPGVPAGNPGMCNPSRYLLWQDPLLGLFDANTRGLGIGAHYGKLAPRLAEAAKRAGDSGPALDILAHLASALELKAELGIHLADAYAARDRGALKRLRDREIPETLRRVRRLRDRHRDVWLEMYKPAGWEIFEIRYGGVMARLETAAARLDALLKGRVERIEELEEPRMLFNGKTGPVRMDSYTRMASASRLSCTL